MPKYLGINYFQQAFEERITFLKLSTCVEPNYLEEIDKYPHQGLSLYPLFRTPWKRAVLDQDFIMKTINVNEIKSELKILSDGKKKTSEPYCHTETTCKPKTYKCGDFLPILTPDPQFSYDYSVLDDSKWQKTDTDRLHVFVKKDLTILKNELEMGSSWCLEILFLPDPEVDTIKNIVTLPKLLKRMPPCCSVHDPWSQNKYDKREVFSDSTDSEMKKEDFFSSDMFNIEAHEKYNMNDVGETSEELLNLEKNLIQVDLQCEYDFPHRRKNDHDHSSQSYSYEYKEQKILKALLESPVIPHDSHNVSVRLMPPRFDTIPISPIDTMVIMDENSKREINKKVWQKEKHFIETRAKRLTEPTIEEWYKFQEQISIDFGKRLKSLQPECELGDVELKISWDPSFYSKLGKLTQVEKCNSAGLETVVEEKTMELFKPIEGSVLFEWTDPFFELPIVCSSEEQKNQENDISSDCIHVSNIDALDDFLLMRKSNLQQTCDMDTLQENTANLEENFEQKKPEVKVSDNPTAPSLGEQIINSANSYNPISVIGSCNFTKNTDLLQLLETRYNVLINEKNYDTGNKWSPAPDLVIDERTCIVLHFFDDLADNWQLESLIAKIVKLSYKCTDCWLLLLMKNATSESYPKLAGGESNLHKLYGSLKSFASQNEDFRVQVMICTCIADSALCIRKICESKIERTKLKGIDDLKYMSRSQLNDCVTKVEKFLLCLPCLNAFSALMLRKECLIKEIFTLSFNELKNKLFKLPERILKTFYQSITCDVGLQLRHQCPPALESQQTADTEASTKPMINLSTCNSLLNNKHSLYNGNRGEECIYFEREENQCSGQGNRNDMSVSPLSYCETDAESQSDYDFNSFEPNQNVLAEAEGQKFMESLNATSTPLKQGHAAPSILNKHQNAFDFQPKDILNSNSDIFAKCEKLCSRRSLCGSNLCFSDNDDLNMNMDTSFCSSMQNDNADMSTDHNKYKSSNKTIFEPSQRSCMNAHQYLIDDFFGKDNKLSQDHFGVTSRQTESEVINSPSYEQPLLNNNGGRGSKPHVLTSFNTNYNSSVQGILENNRSTGVLQFSKCKGCADQATTPYMYCMHVQATDEIGTNSGRPRDSHTSKKSSFNEELSTATRCLLKNTTTDCSMKRLFQRPQIHRISVGLAQPFLHKTSNDSQVVVEKDVTNKPADVCLREYNVD